MKISRSSFGTREELCLCECHTSDLGVRHIMPCCVSCPSCGRQINYFSWEEHRLIHEALEDLINDAEGDE